MKVENRNREHEFDFTKILLDLCEAAPEDGEIEIQGNVVNGEKIACIRKLVVRSPKGEKGHGTAFMERICKAADEKGITLDLTIAYSGQEQNARLQKFYRNLGFEILGNTTARRKPKKKFLGWLKK